MSEVASVEAPGNGSVSAMAFDCGEDVCMKKVLDRKALATDIGELNQLNNWIPPVAILVQWLIISVTIALTVWSGQR